MITWRARTDKMKFADHWTLHFLQESKLTRLIVLYTFKVDPNWSETILFLQKNHLVVPGLFFTQYPKFALNWICWWTPFVGGPGTPWVAVYILWQVEFICLDHNGEDQVTLSLPRRSEGYWTQYFFIDDKRLIKMYQPCSMCNKYKENQIKF